MNTKKLWLLILIILAIVILPPLIVPLFVPWSEINCRHVEIDISNGKIRLTRKLWYITISEKVKDSLLSKNLQGESVNAADIDNWHRVNTYSFVENHSPHYIFHSAIAQIKQLEMLYKLKNFSSERKKAIAKSILTAWQKSGNDKTAEAIIEGFFDNVELKTKSREENSNGA